MMHNAVLRRIQFGLLVVWVTLGGVLLSCRQPAEDVIIGTGNEDGTFYPLGAQLAWLIEQGDYRGVGSVVPKVTAGSVENLRLLDTNQLSLGLVGESKLLQNRDYYKDSIHVLSRLYTSVLHVVVSHNLSDVRHLSDLPQRSRNVSPEPLKIFLDVVGSGARETATKLLEHLQVPPSSYEVDNDIRSYSEAATQLARGDIDLAIILEAMPSQEVEMALELDGGARLIGLGEHVPNKLGIGIEVIIPKYLYPGQRFPITTIGDPAYLVARADLSEEVVVAALDSLFENANELATEHSIVTDNRERALTVTLPEGFQRHRGVELFKQREESKLVIASASANGSYFETGRILQGLLENRGIPSIVLQTDGSLENLKYLKSNRPTLAILQYDIALASQSYDAKAVYKDDPPKIIGQDQKQLDKDQKKGWKIERVEGMKRIATLYDEAMYIFSRKTPDGEFKFTLENHEGARVCFGPNNSGTQILARTVLGETKVQLGRAEYLPVDQMIRQLHNGHLDIGFAVTNSRSAIVTKLLSHPSVGLIPVTPKIIERIRGPAIQPHSVSSPYSDPTVAAKSISTIKTNAVLVVNGEVSDDDAETIAAAMVDGWDLLLGWEGLKSEDALKRIVGGSSSIKLHPAVERFYQEKNLMPAPEKFDLLQYSTAIIGLLLGVVSLVSILLGVRNYVRVQQVEQEIIQVKTGADSKDSVRNLSKFQVELNQRLDLPWWKGGSLTTTRWQSIDELIEKRIAIARQALTRALVTEIRDASRMAQAAVLQKQSELRERILGNFEHGEIDAEQCDFLLRILPKEPSFSA